MHMKANTGGMDKRVSEAHKAKFLEDTDRQAVLKLTNVLTGLATREGRESEEALYHFEQQYTGEKGKGFTVKNSAGKVTGFLSYRITDAGPVIDQMCVDPTSAEATEVMHSLVESAMEYAGKDGSHTMDIRVADSSDFKEVLKEKLGFESTGEKEGEMFVLRKKRVH